MPETVPEFEYCHDAPAKSGTDRKFIVFETFFIVIDILITFNRQGPQRIDPTHLVGYQTSSSSGGYQTNRGEAQLRDDTSYQQSRSVYETSHPPQNTASEAACGCAASAEMGTECDCEMQG